MQETSPALVIDFYYISQYTSPFYGCSNISPCGTETTVLVSDRNFLCGKGVLFMDGASPPSTRDLCFLPAHHCSGPLGNSTHTCHLRSYMLACSGTELRSQSLLPLPIDACGPHTALGYTILHHINVLLRLVLH